MKLTDYLRRLWLIKGTGVSVRTKEAVKNIGVSVVAKVIAIFVSLLLVPMTISYVNTTQYGIWLAISSIVGWVTYFNFGLSNGFRNRFAEAIAKNDTELAKQYVSTTYFSIGVVVLFLLLVTLVGNSLIDWSSFLKIDGIYRDELKTVFAVLCMIFCMNMFLRVFCTMLIADQKPGWESIISCVGQLLSLTSIFFLTKFTKGSLVNLALYFSGVPTVTILVASIIGFSLPRYRRFAPSFNTINVKLIKNILGLGIKFFIINLCIIAVFQMVNLVLTREVGPESVTEYNIAYKYFNVYYTFMIVVITPFWSAFTDAYAKNDYVWMRKTLKKLEQLWLLSVFVCGVMLLLSSWFYTFWIGDSVHIPFSLSVLMMAYMLVQVIACIYMYVINGIGTIQLQLYIYIVFALVSWPLLTWSCQHFGIYGILLLPSTVYLIQAVIARIQLHKVLSKTAAGIWAK